MSGISLGAIEHIRDRKAARIGWNNSGDDLEDLPADRRHQWRLPGHSAVFECGFLRVEDASVSRFLLRVLVVVVAHWSVVQDHDVASIGITWLLVPEPDHSPRFHLERSPGWIGKADFRPAI